MHRLLLLLRLALLVQALCALSGTEVDRFDLEAAAGAPSVDYYRVTCSSVEPIVRRTVADHFRRNRLLAAGVLRLFFHDCFVEGCDGSVLLDRPPDGSVPEKESIANNNSVTGFRVIDDAKRRVEESCPGVVSCADILALAARDAVRMSGGPYWKVPLGRLDGRVSLGSNADDDIPFPAMTVKELKDVFFKKGLNTHDMVTLSGAHTIGRAHCSAFEDRLYNFSGTNLPDPTLDIEYRGLLQRLCPQGSTRNISISLDRHTQILFDNSYFQAIVYSNSGLLQTDQQLLYEESTSGLVKAFASNVNIFFEQFVRSMVKLGLVGWKKPEEGEVRKQCRRIN